MADRDYDVVLLGATGFTGALVATHLDRRLAGTETRWAIAGRDRDKLHALAARLTGDPGVEVVDVHDLVGLLALAGRTRVLGTTVGPYTRHGELVVQACVRAGAHYADITGEPAFVDLVRDRYHDDAGRRGTKIVTCCGFDSVPPDLGVRFTVARLPDDVPLTVRGYVRAEGRVSGGTVASALETIASRAERPPRRPRRTDDARRATSLPARIHRVAELDAWGIPLPTIDPAIVLRSARVLGGYGSAFRYGHYARVRRLPTAIGGIAAIGAATAMASSRPTRSLLARLLPAPGEGPDEATRDRGRFELTFLGHGGGARVVTRVSGGDPGYQETSKMLGEALLSLAQDRGPDVAGVLTPAVALGAPYHDRLVDQGIGFETVAG